MIKNSFYNTVSLEGATLIEAETKAVRQEDNVLALFKEHKSLSPSQIEGMMKIRRGSLSRSLTNLTKAGKLIKTVKKVEGDWGSPEHVWMLADNPAQYKLNFDEGI